MLSVMRRIPPFLLADGMVVPHAFPVVLGWDVAGVVDEVRGGGPFRRGDDVVAFTRSMPVAAGALADYVAVGATAVARKPASLGWTEAAVLPLAGLTADQLVEALDGAARQRVLVLGAGGGVGTFTTHCSPPGAPRCSAPPPPTSSGTCASSGWACRWTARGRSPGSSPGPGGRVRSTRSWTSSAVPRSPPRRGSCVRAASWCRACSPHRPCSARTRRRTRSGRCAAARVGRARRPSRCADGVPFGPTTGAAGARGRPGPGAGLAVETGSSRSALARNVTDLVGPPR